MDSAGLITRLAGFFDSRINTPAWLVGGVVRDALLGREAQDIDIAVPGDVQSVGHAVADHLGATAVPLPEWNIVRVALPGIAENARPFLIDISGFMQDPSKTISSLAILPSTPWPSPWAAGTPTSGSMSS